MLREKDKLRDESAPEHKPQRYGRVEARCGFTTHAEAKAVQDAKWLELANEPISGDSLVKIKIFARRKQGKTTFDVVTYRLLAKPAQAQPATAS